MSTILCKSCVFICCFLLIGCKNVPLIKDANYYYHEGVILSEKDRFTEAEKCFSKVIEKKPEHINAYYNLGVIYDERMMLPEAIEAYEKVISLDPGFYEAWYRLGVIQCLEGNDPEAINCFKKVLEYEPQHQGACYNLAILYNDEGDCSQALSYYKKIVEINPKNIQALNNLGLLYAEKKYYVLAEDSFKKARRINPDYCEAYNNLGVLYAEQGEYEKAVQEFGEVIYLDRNNPESLLNLINIYKDHLHDYVRAKENIELFIKRFPRSNKVVELKKNLVQIDTDLDNMNKDFVENKGDKIRTDIAAFIENVQNKRFIEFYDLQPEDLRNHIPRHRWQADMSGLSDEILEAQKKSVIGLIGFRKLGAYKVTGIEMVSPTKAKVKLAAAEVGELGSPSGVDERISYWEEYNGMWAPSRFLQRVKENWKRARQAISRMGD